MSGRMAGLTVFRPGIFALCLALGLTVFWEHAADGAALITTNSTWKFKRGRANSAPASPAWRSQSLNDSSWKTWTAPFHYGEKLQGGTDLEELYGSYTCIFLRKRFDVADPSEVKRLILNARCDDGFIAWINGVEVWRFNMPDGEIPPSGVALSPREPGAFISHGVLQPEQFLVKGKNVLAVQAFNAALRSGDFFFDLELAKASSESKRPSILSVNPAPGPIGALSQIEVTFDELVMGVKASDLRVNGQPASRVAGSDRVYTFSIGPRAEGVAQVTWDPNQAIRDLAQSPNHFQGEGPGAVWEYEAGDQALLRVGALFPPKGLTVGQLAAVEVTFNGEVTGVQAEDLLLNGQPAFQVTGRGPGPYRFEFTSMSGGLVEAQWRPNHLIRSLHSAQEAFSAERWHYLVDPAFPVNQVSINEIMAAYDGDYPDEDGNISGWIELYNAGPLAINLEGWSMSNDPRNPEQWIFPASVLAPQQYLVIFASDKNRRSPFRGAQLHTNFRLNSGGEYLALYDSSSPRRLVSQFSPGYPEQYQNHSYGFDPSGEVKYFAAPSPGGPNNQSRITDMVAPVQFNLDHGVFEAPITLVLSTFTPGAEIRYTLDGSEPSSARGNVYSSPIRLTETKVVRATAFRPNYLPSAVQTRTYVINTSAAARSLPILSLVIDPATLQGENGIFGIKGGKYLPVGDPRDKVSRWERVSPGDYHNPSKTGLAWERPVSIELLPGEFSKGFQANAGLRVQGSDTSRLEYRSNSKFSFRVYFRGRYGPRNLEYPFFGDLPVREFGKLDLRAGHNDPVNPFITDEMMRRLFTDTGQVGVHGLMVNLFLNGEYRGYYNPTERIETDFLRSWHGGTNDWDVINPISQVRNGDNDAWLALTNYAASHDLRVSQNYLEAGRRLDLTNFVDYLLVNLYGDTHDWTLNNWNAARERTAQGRFRFYIRDAEFALGIYEGPPSHNSIEDPNDLGNGWEISSFFRALRRSPEFKLLFADRIQKHFFNGGALTDANVLRRFEELRDEMAGVLPKMKKYIGSVWIPNRRGHLMGHFSAAGFLGSDNAPVFSQHGGRVSPDFRLTMRAARGRIYYTTDGKDPRVLFSGDIASSARGYLDSPIPIAHSLTLKARSLNAGVWSALTEASFEVPQLESPIRISEIMYHPGESEAYEFIEIFNNSQAPFDLSGFYLSGVTFTFPPQSVLGPQSALVLGSGLAPAAFATRYPGVPVAGYFQGSLANGGEKIELHDSRDKTMASVQYKDDQGWAQEADGSGASLEIISLEGDPNDPANWKASAGIQGSPGVVAAPASPVVGLNEIMAAPSAAAGTAQSWIEIYNGSSTAIDLDQWSLTLNGNPQPFIFPPGTILQPHGYQLVFCDPGLTAAGLNSGFPLDPREGALFLYNAAGARVDARTYGSQVRGYAVGRVGPERSWRLTLPTPSGANVEAEVASPTNLKLNEWLANPLPGEEDWIELYNGHSLLPAALPGLTLRTSNDVFTIKSLSFVPPQAYLQLFADRDSGPAHLDFKLSANGDLIELLDKAGALLDSVTLTPQVEGTAQGRSPDGSGPVISFPQPTPGSSNSSSPGRAQPTAPRITAIELRQQVSSPREMPPSLPRSGGEGRGEEGLSNRHKKPLSPALSPLRKEREKIPNLVVGWLNSMAVAPRIESLRLEGDQLRFRFNAQTDQSYSLIYRGLGSSGPWIKAADFGPFATSQSVIFSQTVPPDQSAQIYRLISPASR